MSYRDILSLAELLDKNHAFKRPEGQCVGYSLQEEVSSAVGVLPSSVEPTVGNSNPSSIPLPATVIDQQLRLPVPSESREAKRLQVRRRQAGRPKGYDIWTEKELCEALQIRNDTAVKPKEGAEEPEYDILHQERMTAEDLYLGVDPIRTGASGLIVKIAMPKQAGLADLVIEVDPFELRVSSNRYFLRAALPRKVVSGNAEAKWNEEQKMLTVSLLGDDSDRMF
ncbi:putative pre RNA processing PIH1 Nop17 [Trypanosoma vivax]|uniref:PIH1D1/2/3 CS-like domain-containing protein n=1 Tax=Trypanosoma vivax (strain Y486) TaxID=1055687 RepID=G0TTB1_TRYVY|nr:putative pre RNA processing PIH1 Nop17 [Trypanosoma vivax]CCC47192.1 conserved hypothetical protein [Trypanosoma vivax Y486]